MNRKKLYIQICIQRSSHNNWSRDQHMRDKRERTQNYPQMCNESIQRHYTLFHKTRLIECWLHDQLLENELCKNCLLAIKAKAPPCTTSRWMALILQQVSSVMSSSSCDYIKDGPGSIDTGGYFVTKSPSAKPSRNPKSPKRLKA